MTHLLSLILASSLLSAFEINETHRVVVEKPAYGKPQIINDDKGYVYVTLADDKSDRYNIELMAYDISGKVLASMKLARPAEGEYYYLTKSYRAKNGDIMAVVSAGHSVSRRTLWLDNITQKTGVRIVEAGNYGNFLDRIEFRGQSLVATSTGLGRGPDGDTVLVRVRDAEKGKVVAQRIFHRPGSGKLAIDSKGRLKLLYFGYEIFGLLDVFSGDFEHLQPERVQPSFYPSIKQMEMGEVVSFSDSENHRLFDLASLIEGEIKTISEFPNPSHFIEGTNWVAHVTDKVIQFIDGSTGESVGQPLSIDRGGVADIIKRADGTHVVALHRPKYHNSFMPGTVFQYHVLETGEKLRELKSDKLCTTQLFSHGPKALAYERCDYHSESVVQAVVELAGNFEVVSNNRKYVGGVFLSGAGTPLILNRVDDQLCLEEILDSKRSHCFKDPMLSPDVRYGYGPFEVSKGKLILPLLDVREGRRQSQGLVAFEIN